MILSIASRGGMCSTLILSDLWGVDDMYEVITGLRGAIKRAEDPENFDTLYNAWFPENKQKQQVLDGHEVSEYAFVVGTVEDDSEAIEPMKKFGFEFSGEVYNDKNETVVLLFRMSVKAMLERLEEFDQNGELIKKEAA